KMWTSCRAQRLPYPTLFRSGRAGREVARQLVGERAQPFERPALIVVERRHAMHDRVAQGRAGKTRSRLRGERLEEQRVAATLPRSEEHTSELQSRENYVCRR